MASVFGQPVLVSPEIRSLISIMAPTISLDHGDSVAARITHAERTLFTKLCEVAAHVGSQNNRRLWRLYRCTDIIAAAVSGNRLSDLIRRNLLGA